MSLVLLLAAGLLQDPALQVRPVQVDPAPEHVALVDLDGDGRKELLAVRGDQVRLERPGGQALTGEIPGKASIWTVADLDADGADEFLVMPDGSFLVRLRLAEEGLDWGAPEVEGLDGSLPGGVRPADFARDLDGDGRLDLVVPDGGRVRLFFGSETGFRPGPDLGVVSRLRLGSGTGRGLMQQVSREILLPRIQMRDLNGDSRPDLQVSEPLEIRQYISGEAGLPAEPTVTVDLQEFQDRLPEIRFDPSNIAGLSRYVVFEEWSDLNLDGALDLIILWGGNVLVYLGGPGGIELRRPYDQMPTRGNVFYAFASRVDGDAVPDLVLMRVEDISLAKALSWYLFSIDLDLDILAYKGQGNGHFARRPLPASKTLTLDLPSFRDLQKSKNRADALRRTVVRLADLDGDGRRDDLALLSDRGELRAWKDVVTDPSVLDEVTQRFLADLLRREKVVPIDVETVTGWLFGRASLLISLTAGREPFVQLPPPPGWSVPQAMTVSDLDGDGADEVILFRRTPLAGPAEAGVPRLVGQIVDLGGGR